MDLEMAKRLQGFTLIDAEDIIKTHNEQINTIQFRKFEKSTNECSYEDLLKESNIYCTITLDNVTSWVHSELYHYLKLVLKDDYGKSDVCNTKRKKRKR